jgi:hypothetical protein
MLSSTCDMCRTVHTAAARRRRLRLAAARALLRWLAAAMPAAMLAAAALLIMDYGGRAAGGGRPSAACMLGLSLFPRRFDCEQWVRRRGKQSSATPVAEHAPQHQMLPVRSHRSRQYSNSSSGGGDSPAAPLPKTEGWMSHLPFQKPSSASSRSA